MSGRRLLILPKPPAPPTRLPAHLYWAGLGLFTATSYSFYRYATHHVAAVEASQDAADQPGIRTFDALAERYDDAIGSEETWMGLGLIRSVVLKHAKGRVLEISAGTGRNLPHYNLATITHLTLTDLSPPMLRKAEDKYFDKLRLGNKHPDTHVSFAVADAHCIVQPTQTLDSIPSTPASTSGRSWGWSGWGRATSQGAHDSHPSGGGSGAACACTDGQAEGGSSKGDGQRAAGRGEAPRGQGGSIFNIFRVLIPGALEGPRTDSIQAASSDIDAVHMAHAFDRSGYEERCVRGSTEAGTPLARFPPGSFDTVVDTYGLCSHDNPVQVLRQAARLCKPDGRLILLEHGRSTWGWLNSHLDSGACRHKEKWGCWYNRDMLSIVHEAGLVVEQESRYHFGTTLLIIASPGKAAQLPGADMCATS